MNESCRCGARSPKNTWTTKLTTDSETRTMYEKVKMDDRRLVTGFPTVGGSFSAASQDCVLVFRVNSVCISVQASVVVVMLVPMDRRLDESHVSVAVSDVMKRGLVCCD